MFKNISDKQIEKALFCLSMIITITLGILLIYTFDFTDNYNLLFQQDTTRVISDISEYVANHCRVGVHPLFLIIVQPLYLIINLLVTNKMITIILLVSLASSITIIYIYKILSLFSDNKLTKILISLCYMFSFTNILFSSSIEIYIFATLFLIILFYYFIKKMKNKEVKNYIFVILGILSIAFTITNYMIFLIVMFVLFISKQIHFTKVLTIVLFSILLTIDFNFIQALVWPNAPFMLRITYKNENIYIDYNINGKSFTNVIKNDLSNGLIANNPNLNVIEGYAYNNANYCIGFQNSSTLKTILIVAFYILCIILVIHNFKKNAHTNLAIILALLFNFSLHLVYGNSDAFLYSPHFIYLIILLFGINLLEEKNKIIKTFSNIFLVIFLIFEIILNSKVYIKMVDIVSHILNYRAVYDNLNRVIYFIIILLISIMITILVYLIIKSIIELYTNKKTKEIIKFIVLIILFKIFFMGINYIANNYIDTNFIMKTNDEVTSYAHSNLENKYREDYIKLIKYKNEYNNFISKYNARKVYNLNQEDFYFFGLANRKKLVFLKTGLYDIDANKYIYEFETKDFIIIPNLYTVIVETTSNDFIKIYENKNGVYFEKNDVSEVITGTDIFINLYEFNEQEYSEIKKVLYSEILFNIKNSKVYPNLFVYDNVWYRDAALVTMVLKETDNINLIKEWVDNIEEIYDYQNSGVKETDNLGELLYIISVVNPTNKKLIEKIKKEASNILKENNKKYLTGLTDYKTRELYQNLWYKFGLESLQEKFKYDLKDLEDDYQNLTWWSNYQTKNNKVYDHDYRYPYLSMAEYHKLKQGSFYVTDSLYPLSWEKDASEADYQKLSIIGQSYVTNKISPTHSWHASEMLLFLLDETGNLKTIKHG